MSKLEKHTTEVELQYVRDAFNIAYLAWIDCFCVLWPLPDCTLGLFIYAGPDGTKSIK